LWWGTRCRQVFTIETSYEWCKWISSQAAARGITSVTVLHRTSAVSLELYIQVPEGCRPDIVVIDGHIRRLACLRQSLTLPRPVTVIFDNWQQDRAPISAQAQALMKPFLGTSYLQLATAHERHPWQTAIWYLE
jgi:hypothetical protein